MVALLLCAGAAWNSRIALWQWLTMQIPGKSVITRTSPKPNPETYAVLVSELERWRKDLARRYSGARSEAERKVVLTDARVILESVLPEMMRCWLGTPWDFNGTAAQPGEGRVACGYFVATVLKDAGFVLDRYRLAQQPSENILRTFLPKQSCVLTIGQDYEQFAAGLENSEPGVYLTGLDTHVAFVVVRPGGFGMIHASGSRPWSVVEEVKDQAHVLEVSNWRMLGHLTRDLSVLKRWLLQDTFDVRGN